MDVAGGRNGLVAAYLNWLGRQEQAEGCLSKLTTRKGEKVMSWSTSTMVITKAKAPDAIDHIEIPQYVEAPALDQIYAAQRAAKELLKSIPGPRVRISMSGHANGVGWQRKKAGPMIV